MSEIIHDAYITNNRFSGKVTIERWDIDARFIGCCRFLLNGRECVTFVEATVWEASPEEVKEMILERLRIAMAEFIANEILADMTRGLR